MTKNHQYKVGTRAGTPNDIAKRQSLPHLLSTLIQGLDRNLKNNGKDQVDNAEWSMKREASCSWYPGEKDRQVHSTKCN